VFKLIAVAKVEAASESDAKLVANAVENASNPLIFISEAAILADEKSVFVTLSLVNKFAPEENERPSAFVSEFSKATSNESEEFIPI
jgi:hypothetical protein